MSEGPSLSVVLIIPVAILLVLVVLVVLILLIAVLVVLLITVLIVHNSNLQIICVSAIVACPNYQDLSFALNSKPARSPANIAAVIPPAVALRPPVNTPRRPVSSIAFFTPFARV